MHVLMHFNTHGELPYKTMRSVFTLSVLESFFVSSTPLRIRVLMFVVLVGESDKVRL